MGSSEAPGGPGTDRAPGIGFGRRVAGVFGLVAVLFASLEILATLQASAMHVSVGRLLEEQREAGFSRELVHELHLLEAHVTSRGAEEVATDPGAMRAVAEYVTRARTILDQLLQGPLGADPSSARHQTEEARLGQALRTDLARFQAELAAGALSGTAREMLGGLRREAEVLHDEMRRESLHASDDLHRRVGTMRSGILWTTLAVLGILASVLWMVRRSVVRPVLELRRGVARIAGGDLGHRVPVTSRDEIGDLAREFNRMAREIQGMRGDLERRVEERTNEFLRAARLAGLGTMAAGIAHEINNPLASIASCAEGLERRLSNGPFDPAQGREYLRIIAKEAYRARDITARMLEFARHEGSVRIPFSVAELLGEIRVLLEHRLRAGDLRLDVRCDPSLPPMEGNPAECKQVLLNLIHNAIDASPRGATIRVECRKEEEEAVLEVEDRGPGIAPENAERIFDPFFTTKAPGAGTGLGLAIVHRIVEGHGGRIEARNTGTGALFRVRIPLRRVARP